MSGYIGNSPFTKASYENISVVATEGQTTFNVSYSPNFLDVLLNGVELDKTDYVATNGTSVVLNTPTTGTAANPDTVTFKIWGTFEVADTYSMAQIDTRYGVEGRTQSVDDVTPDRLIKNGDTGEGLTAMFGVGQASQDLTASRTIGVEYQNNSGKPIEVKVFASNLSVEGFHQLEDRINVLSKHVVSAVGRIGEVSAIIPNMGYYKLTSGVNSATNIRWLEIR